MKKIKLILFFITLLSIPFNINAGIICNDGWESSCSVSGPGCCSHHGGVSKSNYNYSKSNNNDNYYNDKKSDFIENLKNGEYNEILTLILLIILFSIALIGEFNSNKNNNKRN